MKLELPLTTTKAAATTCNHRHITFTAHQGRRLPSSRVDAFFSAMMLLASPLRLSFSSDTAPIRVAS